MGSKINNAGRGSIIALTTLLAAMTASTASAEIVYYRLELSGVAGGDQDGEAHGTLSIDSETGRVIWGLYYSGIDTPSAMHIHQGAAGESGGVVLPLSVESKLGDGALTGRIVADLEVVARILENPTGFYVNVHNGEFRGGALRAQLGTEWAPVM